MASTILNPRALRALFLLTIVAFTAGLWAQSENEWWRTPFTSEMQDTWLYEVLPEADEFGEKQGEPPVWPGYRSDPESGERELVGYAFLSAEWPPQERGFSGPVDMLIGVNTDHDMTGVKLLDYVEAHVRTKGDFLGRRDLLSQYRGKSISDEFRITEDIDGIAGSTVSIFAISRGARNAARQVAETHLGYDPGDPVQDARNARIIEQMSEHSWDQMLENGKVQQMEMPVPGGESIVLSLTYMGHPALGEFWIGPQAYARAERDASAYLAGEQMVLLAIGGSASRQFRYDQLRFSQDGSPARMITAQRFVPAGNADAGMIAGRADFAGAFVAPDNIDITRPFTLSYRPLGSLDPYSVDFEPVGVGMQLARGEDVLSEEEIEAIIAAQNRWLNQFLADPPWGVTPWDKVIILSLILTLAMVAFLRKSTPLRWAALGATTLYLGFIDGSFLSISHITGVLTQGPGFLMSNLPLLLFATFTVVTTVLWGRVFCSSLCPFGAVQDFITRFTPKRWQRQVSQSVHDKALYLKYLILALIVSAAVIAGNVAIFQYFEPFGTLFFLEGALILWVILFAILAACFVVPRFYCRYACPLGAALGLASLISPLRIKRVPQCTVCAKCEQACPTGAIRREKIDFKECVRCDDCEIKLIEKAGACRHDMDRIIASSKAG